MVKILNILFKIIKRIFKVIRSVTSREEQREHQIFNVDKNTIIELNVMCLQVEEKGSRQTANGDFSRLNK